MRNIILVLFAALICAATAFAEEAPPTANGSEFSLDPALVSLANKVRLNGFISQGFLQSNGNNFLADTKNGTTEFNEIGLTINADVTSKLRLGVQLLSRDLGEVGNNEVRLDWASADYHAWDYLGFRVGKVKLPMGLYNQSRDSDFLRNMIFLPQSIYDDTKRDLLVAYQGGSVYGNIPMKVMGDLEYQGFYGEINFPNDSTLLTQLKNSSQQTLVGLPITSRPQVSGYASSPSVNPVTGATTAPAAPNNFGYPSYITSFKMENKYIGGGSLVYNTPLPGFRLGASYLTVGNDIYVNSSNPNGELKMKRKTVYSAEYTLKNFVLAGEYSETHRRQVLLGKTQIDAPSQEYYVMSSYTMFDCLTLSALYDIYYDQMGDKDGERYKAAGSKSYDFQGWRKDMGVGVRYDVNQFWTLKAEYHDISGAALFTNVFNPPTVVGGKPNLRKDWNYFAFKASFNF